MVPNWDGNVTQRSRNGTLTRLVTDSYPRWTFELSYEFLRASHIVGPSNPQNPNNHSEVDQIVGFFNQCKGGFGDFLLDPSLLTGVHEDGYTPGASLGVGDGVTTTFQLQRNQGGFLDEVQNPVSPVKVIGGGAWTLGNAGQITFAAAPPVGAVLSASFQWKWRCRFAEDSLNLNAFMFQLYELQSLKLEQVKL